MVAFIENTWIMAIEIAFYLVYNGVFLNVFH